jgi:hypothetical protein
MDRTTHSAPSGEAIKGAAAGVIGTVAMDLLTWNMYRRESEGVYRREKAAQRSGKWAGHVAAEKLAKKVGITPSPRGLYAAGKGIHFMLGIGPAVGYALLRRRHPKVAAGMGALFGLAVFVLNDEVAAPAMGLASGPRKYPWQAHLRGLLGHLTFGIVTEAALNAITWEARRAREGWAL